MGLALGFLASHANVGLANSKETLSKQDRGHDHVANVDQRLSSLRVQIGDDGLRQR